MTMPKRKRETCVHEKRIVHPGDKVELLPVNLRKKDEEDGDHFARKQFNFLREWLGDGPFTISWIGRWPCGKTMLYLKGTEGNEPGVSASEFM